MNPVQIKIFEKNNLLIKWNDNSETKINLKYLRDECPCASCKGETILLKTYRPAKPAKEIPGMYKIGGIQTVGGYAIQITWKDGHNTGLYTWDYLRQLELDQAGNSNHYYENII